MKNLTRRRFGKTVAGAAEPAEEPEQDQAEGEASETSPS
jgi:hypothetical protein